VGERPEDTLVEGESFELEDGDGRPDYDSTSEDSAFTYERIDGEDSDVGVEVADGGGHRLEATWARALEGYPLERLEMSWVVEPSVQMLGMDLSVEISDVLSNHLKWQRARFAQQLLVHEYHQAKMEGMVGAPVGYGQPIDEMGCRESVRELSAQIEEVERLGKYVHEALRMHSGRFMHECLETQTVRRGHRREQRRRYSEEDRRAGRGVQPRRWRRVHRGSPEMS
jgi:hypothetical protein